MLGRAPKPITIVRIRTRTALAFSKFDPRFGSVRVASWMCSTWHKAKKKKSKKKIVNRKSQRVKFTFEYLDGHTSQHSRLGRIEKRFSHTACSSRPPTPAEQHRPIHLISHPGGKKAVRPCSTTQHPNQRSQPAILSEGWVPSVHPSVRRSSLTTNCVLVKRRVRNNAAAGL